MAGRALINLNKIGFTVVLSTVLLMAGCDENGGVQFPQLTGNQPARTAGEPGQSVQLVERDVEAPDAFQVTEAGLWDGRPSLGGVWVAHPDVTEPERVIIRNQANGTFVIGALFRRERENPGPSLQVSSDAAAALEMLAGAPARLQVTALRREEVAQTPQSMATTDFAEPAGIAETPIDSVPLDAPPFGDAIANAAAAIETAEQTAEAARPAPAPRAAAASSLGRPFIQIGIFSIEANATGTADRLRATGIVPTVLQQTSQGRTFWRVLVGPVATETERENLLRQVKSQGFSDAYAVTN